MKHLWFLAALTLAGCADNTEYPTNICRERDTVSGKCLRGEYICTAPMELRAYYGGPVCIMPGKPQ